MWRFRTVRVAEHERAVWFRDGNFEGVLTPGRYRFFKPRTEVSVYGADEVEFDCRALRHVIANHRDALEQHMQLIALNDDEIALLRINGIARQILSPGTVAAYWTHAQEVTLDVEPYVAGAAVPGDWLRAINLAGSNMIVRGMDAHLVGVNVDRGHSALLLIDGDVVQTLAPGRYAFWRGGRSVSVVSADLRPLALEVNGQEILTKDRVSLRLNAALSYRIQNAVTALVETADVEAMAYRAVQFALRAAVGGVTFDELLGDKEALGQSVAADAAAALESLGLRLETLGVKDIILPGEMKTILNQVVEAEKEAEANAVRRRDQSANVRALANTARMLENNPGMARLKELEVLESVTERVESLHVMNGLDGLLHRLVPGSEQSLR